MLKIAEKVISTCWNVTVGPMFRDTTHVFSGRIILGRVAGRSKSEDRFGDTEHLAIKKQLNRDFIEAARGCGIAIGLKLTPYAIIGGIGLCDMLSTGFDWLKLLSYWGVAGTTGTVISLASLRLTSRKERDHYKKTRIMISKFGCKD